MLRLSSFTSDVIGVLSSMASAAQSALGLGGAATLNVGTAAGTVAAGNDSRFTTISGATINNSTIGMTTPAPGNFTAMNTGQLANRRNVLINGRFDVWQRASSFTSPLTLAFLADRWFGTFDGTGAVYTVTKTANTQAALQALGIGYYLAYAVTTAGSGGTIRQLMQRVEGVRTLSGQQVTVSAWLWADAARSVTVNLTQNFGTTGGSTAVSQTAITWNVTTTPTLFTATFTLPSINGKTLGSVGDDNLQVTLGLPINTAMTINMTGAQLEIGPVATPNEFEPIGIETNLCCRYFLSSTVFAKYQSVTAAYTFGAGSYFPNLMRATPTITLLVSSAVNSVAPTLTALGNAGISAVSTNTAAGTATIQATYTASAEM